MTRLGLTYHITCPPVLNPKTDKPYVYFKVLHDTKQLIDYDRPLDWMNYCNNKSNKDIEEKEFQKYCFLGVNGRLHLCTSASKFILLDMQPEDWIQKSDRWKIFYDDRTEEGLVQIYDNVSLKAVTYYIENDRKIDNFPDDVPWNSKKWRVLLFFDKETNFVMASKQYPLQSDEALGFFQKAFEAAHKNADGSPKIPEIYSSFLTSLLPRFFVEFLI